LNVDRTIVTSINIKNNVHLYVLLDNSKLFFEFPSGFRSNFSTDTSLLIHLTYCIRFEMDKGNMFGMLLLDFRRFKLLKSMVDW